MLVTGICLPIMSKISRLLDMQHSSLLPISLSLGKYIAYSGRVKLMHFFMASSSLICFFASPERRHWSAELDELPDAEVLLLLSSLVFAALHGSGLKIRLSKSHMFSEIK